MKVYDSTDPIILIYIPQDTHEIYILQNYHEIHTRLIVKF